MTEKTPGYAPAHINPEAVFWLNASDSVKDALRKAGAAVPIITDDDRYAAAQERNKSTHPIPQP